MTQQVEMLEGTWEEIAAHAEALKGRRLQLLILPAIVTAPATNGAPAPGESLAEALKNFIGSVSFEPTDVAQRSEELWGEYVKAKHERIHSQIEAQEQP